MTPVAETAGITDAETYHQVQQFYARQMQLLDAGSTDAWADTFTPDGVFAANAHPEPTSGREAIRAAARRAADDLAQRKIIRRHWLGMLAIAPREDGTVFARSYAMVLETPGGGSATLRMSTVCEDTLVRADGEWLVRDRQVRRDDIA